MFFLKTQPPPRSTRPDTPFPYTTLSRSKLLEQPGAPMAKRHADDLVFYATIGVILGGRIGYVLFYAPGMLLDPLQVFKLWDGGMSFHGGVIGTSLAMIVLARRKGLDWLQIGRAHV